MRLSLKGPFPRFLTGPDEGPSGVKIHVNERSVARISFNIQLQLGLSSSREVSSNLVKKALRSIRDRQPEFALSGAGV